MQITKTIKIKIQFNKFYIFILKNLKQRAVHSRTPFLLSRRYILS